jgi:RND family efflux transporter MFP subunit
MMMLAAAPTGAETLEGVLDGGRQVELDTLVSGVVAEVPVEPGQRVAAGAALVRLDQRDFEVRGRRVRAAVASAEPQLAEAQRGLERTEELYDRTSLADHDVELARIAVAQAESALEVARADLAEAELDLERSTVRAPLDAQVLAVQAVPGQVVVNRLQVVPLVTVADVGRPIVRARVPAERRAGLEVGQAVTVQAGGQMLGGRISGIAAPSAADAAQVVTVGLDEVEETMALRAGLPARVELP